MKDLGLISQHNINTFPELRRYWNNLNDEEKQLYFDKEGLWSYTPQILATNIAQKLKGEKIIDLFCGVGGSSIGFAKAGKQVVAVDISENRLKLAAMNAEKAGLKNKICFYNENAFAFLKTLNKTDCIFLDPPWGGSFHRDITHFSFDDFKFDIKQTLKDCLEIAENVIIKLPFNFQIEELPAFKENLNIIEHHMPNYENDRPVFLSAHFN